jgi:mannosyl-oligosaccharide glucosidase
MHWSISPALAFANVLLAASQDTSVFTKSSNDSLLWGPYRPNLYFGVRPRLPKSVTTGLLWGRVEEFGESIQRNVRYTCEQNEDMEGYGWDKYDPRLGGVQTVYDKGNGINMETSFVKFDEGRAGWGARIKGTVREDALPQAGSQNGVKENLKTSVWFTVGVEGLSSLDVLGAEAGAALGFDRNVVLSGETTDLGEFSITVAETPDKNTHAHHSHPSFNSKPLSNTLVHSTQVKEEALWQSLRMWQSVHLPLALR